jgi:hypothetical protein
MISLLSLYNEAKQVGKVYHFTDYDSALSIVKDGYKLKNARDIRRPEDKVYYVSFSRNKDLKSNTISSNVRFSIDGDKLSTKYKVAPYADTKAGYTRKHGHEAEERVETKDGTVDFSNSLLSIEIKNINNYSDEDFDEEETSEPSPPSMMGYNNLIKYLKANDIPFTLVDNYK